MTPREAVLATIDAFGSVGADRFTISCVGIGRTGNSPEKLASAEETRLTLPGIVAEATRRMQSVIIRPYSNRKAFTQLDDLDREAVEFLAAVGFIALRTSPGSYQVWIACESQGKDSDAAFSDRLQRGMLADPNANGATRCGGSRNFQEKHRANGFPVVAVQTYPGRVTKREQLESLGIVAPEIVPGTIEHPAPRVTQRATGGAWPRYEVALQRAPRKSDGTPDRSKADFAFTLTALSWGRPAHEIAERLACVSARASEWCAERGMTSWEREVQRTISNAARFATNRAA
jgi:RepB DNA-primase from phage plasmid